MFNEYNFPLSFNSLKHVFDQFSKGYSVCRLIHNYFLKSISLNGKVLDLGSKEKYSSYDFMQIAKIEELIFSDKLANSPNVVFSDFEKKIEFESNKFDNVILFNVLEHVENYENLISEINRVLKDSGQLNLYVPFMHYYHEDPIDIFRPTHFYLNKILKRKDFDVKVTNIGSGPFTVIADIGCHYLYFAIFKTLFFIFCLSLEKFRRLFSKTNSRYYLGIHAECLKK